MLVETFKEFFYFSGLRPNTKCETAGLGSLKGVLEALCGLNTVDLINEATKILELYFSYHNEN